MTFEKSFLEVSKLVDDFKSNEKFFLSKAYQEAEVRKDFIDKFFMALGWDVLHDIQKNPYEQEVKVEKGVSVSGAQKRADYSFALAPNFRDAKFFVEAKKPSQDLYDEDYYFQTVRYGWHKATPLAVLTDFEEFHILDCRFSPDISTILKRQVKRFHYSDYKDKEKFAEIYWLFSREAVLANSLEKRAEELPKPRGKAVQKALFPLEKHLTIDDAFLEEIDEIREKLAKAFKKNDDSLNSEELTEATQRTIDRLVFIRFLEDKLIEQEHHVHAFGERNKAWDDFVALCKKLDAKYNGIVFKKCFIDDTKFKGPIDNEFHSICQDICHLNSRFLYNEIPIHILGSIYERFLGKIVHATAKQVKVEPKPEVRIAGGVFYTPKYVVDFIVQNTIGELISGKSPEQISKMRFADISCGSGSFLIGVFDYLLDYHNKYYQANPDKAKKDGCHFKDGIWILSIKQKQAILKNNIYGVDIDNQAVEVSQLSLSLKMLEDETTATANEMQVLFHEKILPNMSKNIVSGNTLIGTDILSQNLFAGEEERKLNPMDFESAFPEIMRNKGFDAIVGNPPYLSMEDMAPAHRDYYYEKVGNNRNRYLTAIHKSNLYAIFYEKAILLTKDNGYIGMITPYSWLSNSSFINLRKLFLTSSSVKSLYIFPVGVFQDAGIATGIVILQVRAPKKGDIASVMDLRTFSVKELPEKIYQPEHINEIPIKSFEEAKGHVFNIQWNKKESPLLAKLEKTGKVLDDFVFVDRGCDTANNDKYTGYEFKKTFNSKPLLAGERFGRYYSDWDNLYLYYLPVQMKKEKETARPGESFRFESAEKLIVYRFLDKNKNLVCTYDNEQFYCLGSCYVINKKENINYDLKFILAVLNSKAISYYNNKLFSGVKVTRNEMLRIPIPNIDLKNKEDKSKHDKVISLVDQLLNAKKQGQTAKTDKDITYFERRCSEIDSQINNSIYDLFNLNSDEINIIEK